MIKLLSANVLANNCISLEFSNNAIGIFQLPDYLLRHKGPLLEALKDDDYVKRCFVQSGALCWPNGLELSPARLYELCNTTRVA